MEFQEKGQPLNMSEMVSFFSHILNKPANSAENLAILQKIHHTLFRFSISCLRVLV
jgi:hypothetical protein